MSVSISFIDIVSLLRQPAPLSEIVHVCDAIGRFSAMAAPQTGCAIQDLRNAPCWNQHQTAFGIQLDNQFIPDL